MRVKTIVPVTTERFIEPTKQEAERYASKRTEIDVEALNYGTASIESAYDELLCAPDILRIVQEAESNEFDGIFIDCMGDPALDASRELVKIPVVGPARTSILFAADLAEKFSIVTILENVLRVERNLAKLAGVSDKLASVRSVDIPVLELEERKKLMNALVEESVKALEEDNAQAIILGCTGMMEVAKDLQDSLTERGFEVPVINPVAVAIKHLESLISLNLSQSKRAYMHPPEKERNLFEKLPGE
ncbi:hydrogenase expression protein HupH [candidate division MSBL1 archaeon SCGC-AAA259J03]|uniref:Hydrogenase expression protein HupH n=1 Tax=candidate division MSBL1 archaeon SCGC-AAA259J03 TaxID=1698269 RepID=A0A656YVH8_9EURY|nr:hydrogenase expression protein HupH [candidate division MSBL1 archaeon SCGC-AAA259J03]